MKKEFWKWHRLKERLNDAESQVEFHEREIWYCSIGINVGYEQDGRHEHFERPVLILKKFTSRIFWGVPLTTRDKRGKWDFQFEFYNQGALIQNVALVPQIRLFDSKRLRRKAGGMNEIQFLYLLKRFKGVFSGLIRKFSPA